MSRILRIGLLGASRIASKAIVLPAAGVTRARVVCVAASNQQRATKFAADNGIDSVAASYADLIGRADIDLVYNALTPRDHMRWSLAALDAGKHVLCEKPFAMNAGQAGQMVQRAEATGKVLLEAFHYRFHPLFHRVVDIVHSGQLGAIAEMTASFQVTIAPLAGEFRHDPALGGGATMDLGCYPVHWARSLLAGEPTVVQATAVEGRPGVDLSMTATLEFAEEQRATITCCMAADDADGIAARLGISGEKGWLEVDNPLSPHTGHELRLHIDGETRREVIPGNTTFDHQLQHVIDVIANGEPALTGGRDAVANMSVIDAIYRRAGMQPRGVPG